MPKALSPARGGRILICTNFAECLGSSPFSFSYEAQCEELRKFRYSYTSVQTWVLEPFCPCHQRATKKISPQKALIFQGFFAFLGRKILFDFVDKIGYFQILNRFEFL